LKRYQEGALFLENHDTMNLKDIKKSAFDKLVTEKPDTAAMLMKNWKRYEACIQFLSRTDALKKDRRILDYGCGHPVFAFLLIELGFEVVPYEPFAEKDEMRTAELLGIQDKVRTTLNAGEVYDLVLMIDVIEHLSIIKPVMMDVMSKVAVNGDLFISTPNVLRAEMWLSFVSRQTGHPQLLEHFLNSDNNYTHHQREFTMKELVRTATHFGFKTVSTACKDTRPDLKDLNKLREVKGMPPKPLRTGYGLIKGVLQRFLIFLFPGRMNNNLLLLAKKL